MDASIFPCWAVVAQMGHREVVGWVEADTTSMMGVPMLRVRLPAAEADDLHHGLPEDVELIAASAVLRVRRITEEEAVAARIRARPHRSIAEEYGVAREPSDDWFPSQRTPPDDGGE